MTAFLMLIFGFFGFLVGAGLGLLASEVISTPAVVAFFAFAGLFTGGWFGRFIGALSRLPSRMMRMEQEVARMQERFDAAMRLEPQPGPLKREYKDIPEKAKPPFAEAVAPPPLDPPIPKQATPVPDIREQKTDEQDAPESPGEESEKPEAPRYTPPPLWRDGAAPEHPSQFERKLEDFVGRVKDFFTKGNVVARVGLVVLFFGVAFLLKYASTKFSFPIEYRFMGVSICAIAMMVLGFRIRERKRMYSLLLQGGGIGILYMTVFIAARMYSLISMEAAFGLMVILAALSGAVAVLQNARATALAGSVGGFLAPVLASTGGGHHVFLFSYYAVLSAGILGIAWFKAWRELNIVGFVFVLGVGASWGAKYYEPEYFWSVEPFVILFFAFYEIIAVLYAFRRPPKLRGIVDGTLVFGTPIAVFTIQAGLVSDIEYGLAYSSLFAAVFYLALSRFLWKKDAQGMRVMTESFLSLCVVFASLAVPLGLSGRWTSAIWALEGAGLVWIGVRQNRVLARCFGQVLQIGSAVAFITSAQAGTGSLPVFNSEYIGAFIISLAALFTSYVLYRNKVRLTRPEQYLHPLFLLWGLGWWFVFGLEEIDQFVGPAYGACEGISLFNSDLIFFAASAFGMHLLISRLEWKPMGKALALYVPTMGFFSLAGVGGGFHEGNPMSCYGWLAWPFSIGIVYYVLKFHENDLSEKACRVWHVLTLWIIAVLAAQQMDWAMWLMFKTGDVWRFISWGIAPGAFSLVLLVKGDKLGWPVSWRRDVYLKAGLWPMLAFLWMWCISGVFHNGEPPPLPYLPLLNPLEIVQAFVLVLLFMFAFNLDRKPEKTVPSMTPRRIAVTAFSATAFLCMNAVLGRTVHYYGGVEFSDLGASMIFQAALSIFWTFCAVAAMSFASRKGLRPVWFIGAGLIAVVTLKLFFVDLSHSGAVSRVVSFLGAGMLMMAVGYTSPLPPQPELENK